MSDDLDNILPMIDKIFDIDGRGDAHDKANISLTVGVVVDTGDPLQQGRLKIFCPSLNDNPKKIMQLPWAAYVSPFGGTVNNNNYTRGPENSTSSGSIHYGFWGIPEINSPVLVGCVDGDNRRRFWLGCFPVHQKTNTLFTGRYKWNSEKGTPDGPLTSTGEPIQPLYNNLSNAFGEKKSREWKTRGAEYQPTSIPNNEGQIPNDNSEVDETYDDIAKAEIDEWVKDVLGSHGYDWTSYKNIGALLASKVFGMSTPGGHSIHMDDRPFNSRTKLKSSTGHQIIMDDTNERIYIMTNKGNNWIEMDSSGNIDIFSESRISVSAVDDINFSTDGAFRVKAKQGIYMYAGDEQGQTPLDSVPEPGEIRLHASSDMHIKSDNLRINAIDSIFLESTNALDVSATDMNIHLTGSYLLSSDDNMVMRSSDTEVRLNGGIEFKTPAYSTNVDAMVDKINECALNIMSSSPLPILPDLEYSPTDIPNILSGAEISPWTSRVPDHEPWPRTLMQDSNDPINAVNQGYKDNVDWIAQFDNTTSPDGIKPIGKIEGDVIIERGKLWRR